MYTISQFYGIRLIIYYFYSFTGEKMDEHFNVIIIFLRNICNIDYKL